MQMQRGQVSENLGVLAEWWIDFEGLVPKEPLQTEDIGQRDIQNYKQT